jgi:hypothetical protein
VVSKWTPEEEEEEEEEELWLILASHLICGRVVQWDSNEVEVMEEEREEQRLEELVI